MKKTLLFILLFIPLMVNGKMTYNDGKTYANSYTRNLNSVNYDKIFIDKNDKIITDVEFDRVMEGKGISYLSSSLDYWGKSSTDNSAILLSSNISYPNNSSKTSGVRVTEYVRNEVEASGSGSYVNPWTLSTGKKIIKMTSVANLLTFDSIVGVGDSGCDTSIEFYSKTSSYYMFYVNKCVKKIRVNYILNDETYTAAEINSSISVGEKTECTNATITTNSGDTHYMMNLSGEEDVTCRIGMKYNKFHVVYNPNGGTFANTSGEDTTRVAGSIDRFQIYGQEYGNWNNKTNNMPSGSTTPSISRTGYTFKGWYTVKNTLNSSNLVTNTSKLLTANEHTLYANWVDETDPVITCTKSNVGSTSGVTINVSCSDSGSGCATANASYNGLGSGNYTYTVSDKANVATSNTVAKSTANSSSCTLSVESYACNKHEVCSSCCSTCTSRYVCCLNYEAGAEQGWCTYCTSSYECCSRCCHDEWDTCYR